MKIWQLLDSPDKWTQGAVARDSQNKSVNWHSATAYKWCVIGAISKCYGQGEEHQQTYEKIQDYLASKGNYWMLVLWNDARETTWQEIHDTCKELDV